MIFGAVIGNSQSAQMSVDLRTKRGASLVDVIDDAGMMEVANEGAALLATNEDGRAFTELVFIAIKYISTKGNSRKTGYTFSLSIMKVVFLI